MFFFRFRFFRCLPNLCIGLLLIHLAEPVRAAEGGKPTNQVSNVATPKPLAAVLPPTKWRQVEESVDRALSYVASRQAADGSFPTIPAGQPGVTSLCVIAFLSRGHQPGLGPYGDR